MKWGNGALRQLRDAHAYLLRENPSAAGGFLDKVERIVRLIEEFPRVGVQTDKAGVFMFPLVRYRYLLFYRVRDDEVVHILRLRHGARRRD